MRAVVPFIAMAIACTVNRTVAVSPEPEQLGAYLRDQKPDDLEITTTEGQKIWIHAPELVGDSLAGFASRQLPPQRRIVVLTDVRDVAESHVSEGRTLGLVGAVLTVAGFAVLIGSLSNDEPIYASPLLTRPE